MGHSYMRICLIRSARRNGSNSCRPNCATSGSQLCLCFARKVLPRECAIAGGRSRMPSDIASRDKSSRVGGSERRAARRTRSTPMGRLSRSSRHLVGSLNEAFTFSSTGRSTICPFLTQCRWGIPWRCAHPYVVTACVFRDARDGSPAASIKRLSPTFRRSTVFDGDRFGRFDRPGRFSPQGVGEARREPVPNRRARAAAGSESRAGSNRLR
jgi:hypothetical protein